jgi:NAD(P)-dependent dehydrogenase (short-subunit alcohol dehydrogenase family)
MDHDLTGKVAIVVGGGQQPGEGIGNGRAMCIMLARHGAKVMVAARHQSRAQDTVDMIKAEGGEATAYEMDATVKEDCKKLMEDTVAKYGRIDILIYNAGILPKWDYATNEITVEQFDAGIHVNLLGCTWCNLYVAPYMIKVGGGVILNISSIASHVNATGVSIGVLAYGMAKAGMNHLTENVAWQYAPDGIRANTLVVGPVASVMGTVDTQRLLGDVSAQEAQSKHAEVVLLKGGRGSTWDTANTALFLVSDESKFITGREIVMDGGTTLSCGAAIRRQF